MLIALALSLKPPRTKVSKVSRAEREDNTAPILSELSYVCVSRGGLLPPEPFLEPRDEAHYLGTVCRLNSVFARRRRKKGGGAVALQRANSILEAKQCFQQMKAYEFIQLVSGSDVNPKHRRNDHPSLEGPVPNAARAHLHSTYWHCFAIKRALMAARVGLHVPRLSDTQIMKHFQQERFDIW